MLNEKRRIVGFYYTDFYRSSGEYSEAESKRNSNIEVEFFGELVIDKETYHTIKSELKEYLSNYEGDDIAEVTKKMKELFDGIPEDKLEVKITSKNHEKNQEVKYRKGILESFSFEFTQWDDVISVSNSYWGTNIRYKKENKYIRTMDDINSINSELSDILEKIFVLQGLEKEESKNHNKNI